MEGGFRGKKNANCFIRVASDGGQSVMHRGFFLSHRISLYFLLGFLFLLDDGLFLFLPSFSFSFFFMFLFRFVLEEWKRIGSRIR